MMKMRRLFSGLPKSHPGKTTVNIRCGAEKTDHRHRRLLRARRHRPRRRATEERDELAPFHSMTSSARASSVGDTVRPSALAVLRLITSSNGQRGGCNLAFLGFFHHDAFR